MSSSASGDLTPEGSVAPAAESEAPASSPGDASPGEGTGAAEAGDTGIDGDTGVDGDDVADPDAEVDPVVHALTTERDLYREMAQRVQADFENYRKRALAQSRDEAERATGRLAEALLPVLDAAEAAYVRHPEEIGPLLNLMLGELRKLGLEALDLQDQPFDPNLADAVAHEAGDGGDVVVAEVLRSGYTWNGRTLRPAMVRTADRDQTATDAAG